MSTDTDTSNKQVPQAESKHDDFVKSSVVGQTSDKTDESPLAVVQNTLNDFHRDYTFKYNSETRMIAHGSATLSYFLGNLRLRGGLVRPVRNAAIFGLLTGVLFNPEIFGPWFNENILAKRDNK